MYIPGLEEINVFLMKKDVYYIEMLDMRLS